MFRREENADNVRCWEMHLLPVFKRPPCPHFKFLYSIHHLETPRGSDLSALAHFAEHRRSATRSLATSRAAIRWDIPEVAGLTRHPQKAPQRPRDSFLKAPAHSD